MSREDRSSGRVVKAMLVVLALGWVTSGALLAQTSDGGTDPILVLNPSELSAAGYPADAGNVYTDGKGGYFQLFAEGESGGSSPEGRAITQRVFGNTAVAYTTIQPADAIAKDEAQQFDVQAGGLATSPSGAFLTCPGGESEGEFLFPLQLDEGVLIKNLRVRGFDNTSNDHLSVQLKKVCQSTQIISIFPLVIAYLEPVVTALSAELATVIAETPGRVQLFEGSIDETVDNSFCTYHVAVDLEGNGCAGSAINFHKASVEWQRQISPAPGTATFGDVSTGHIFFKEIEALVASGVTGGCGGGNYCPDQTVTRGQMAAFLARALGLHWQ